MGMKTHKPHGLTVEILKDLYCQKVLSDVVIGKRFGITGEAVGYYRKKWGIKTMGAVDKIAKRASLSGKRNIQTVSSEEFVDLYAKLGQNKMAEMFGCSKMAISTLRKKYGIGSISKSQRHRRSYPSLTSTQKEVLIGSLLGDGAISKSNALGSYRFYEYHCEKQLGYLEWKHAVLFPFSKKINRGESQMESGNVAVGYKFVTCLHPVFQESYEMFYKPDGKYPDLSVVENLSPLSLAIWYMDDGSLGSGNLGFRREWSIATKYPKELLDKIVRILNERFSLSASILWLPSSKIFLIESKTQSLFDVILPHVRPEMAYKVPAKKRFLLPFNNRPDLVDYLDKLPRDVSSLSESEKITVVENLADYWRILGFPYPVYTPDKRRADLEKVKITDVPLSGQVSPSPDSFAGTNTTLQFFRHFWGVSAKHRKSPMQFFSDRTPLVKILSDMIERGVPVNDAYLRRELRMKSGVYNFRPAVAKAVYDRYCPAGGRVLDPCSGWGGRLFGFHAAKNPCEYVGIDASFQTVKCLRKMQRSMKGLTGKDAVFHYTAYEDWQPEGTFDLVLTSPPYFDKEEYDKGEKQSWIRYPTYLQWREGFLYSLVDKSLLALNDGGYLVLVISNIISGHDKVYLADDLLFYAKQKAHFVVSCDLNYNFPRRGKTGWTDKLFVFSKRLR